MDLLAKIFISKSRYSLSKLFNNKSLEYLNYTIATIFLLLDLSKLKSPPHFRMRGWLITTP